MKAIQTESELKSVNSSLAIYKLFKKAAMLIATGKIEFYNSSNELTDEELEAVKSAFETGSENYLISTANEIRSHLENTYNFMLDK